jgi:sulfate transport system ATP-binding protein
MFAGHAHQEDSNNAPREEGATAGVRFVDVTRAFGSFVAADKVSFDVPAGELVSLLGPSGSGKSTLLRILAGLTQPDTGRVWIGSQDVTDIPPQRRNIGFVFQHYALFKHMTVAENVAFGLNVRKVPKAEVQTRVQELLAKVKLGDKAGRYPAQLSGGERQRVALARALAPHPKVLLLDEPFAAIDAGVRAELREWLQVLHQENPITTLFVTHDQEEALELSDRVVVIHEGKVSQVGTPKQIYSEPASRFVAAFVGPVNKIKFGDNELFIRPSDVSISPASAEHANGVIDRVTFLGDTLKIHVKLRDGQMIIGQVSTADALGLELSSGQLVRVDWRSAKPF